MQVSKYETIAQSFLDAHPIGSLVTASKLVQWVADHADGAVIKADLSIDDPVKRIAALRRHLNDGARSDAMSEDRRFYLQVEDAKRKTYVVRSHAAMTTDQATGAIDKSILGAINPLKRSQKAIDAVKLDELPEIERQSLELARENLTAMEAAVKPTLAQEAERIWIAKMDRLGIPADQARKIRDALPTFHRVQKLLRATS